MLLCAQNQTVKCCFQKRHFAHNVTEAGSVGIPQCSMQRLLQLLWHATSAKNVPKVTSIHYGKLIVQSIIGLSGTNCPLECCTAVPATEPALVIQK
jgi:hypothetical protein